MEPVAAATVGGRDAEAGPNTADGWGPCTRGGQDPLATVVGMLRRRAGALRSLTRSRTRARRCQRSAQVGG
jgi:hypothetical protein